MLYCNNPSPCMDKTSEDIIRPRDIRSWHLNGIIHPARNQVKSLSMLSVAEKARKVSGIIVLGVCWRLFFGGSGDRTLVGG